MGSGETAPTMVKVHREVLAASGDGPAVLLDTPFGFQTNADELVERTLGYFADSVGRRAEVVSWRSAGAPLVARERALALLGRAAWAFAGPGSPTYALRQWIDTPMPAALSAVVRRGGTLVMGSAAAVTLGSHAVPVYEIYKVGEQARWVPGLDLLGALTGIHAAVVPHYDNAEGGTHDTRYCYLGEQRLAAMEAELPDEVGVLGVDEHSALLLDVAAGTAQVRGNGRVTVRRRGHSEVLPEGTQVDLAELRALVRGERAAGRPAAATPVSPVVDSAGSLPGAGATPGSLPAPSLRAEAERARERFDAAVAGRDADACVTAVLELEQAMADWAADTLQSDERDEARRVLRGLVVRLGELAVAGVRDPREAVAPYVELLLDVRARAREVDDFAAADVVRDRLAAAGVEVRDTPAGPQWALASPG